MRKITGRMKKGSRVGDDLVEAFQELQLIFAAKSKWKATKHRTPG